MMIVMSVSAARTWTSGTRTPRLTISTIRTPRSRISRMSMISRELPGWTWTPRSGIIFLNSRSERLNGLNTNYIIYITLIKYQLLIIIQYYTNKLDAWETIKQILQARNQSFEKLEKVFRYFILYLYPCESLKFEK